MSRLNAMRFSFSLLIVTAALTGVVAQTRPGTTPPPATTATTATAASATTSTSSNVQQSLQEILEEPSTGETYRYDPQGRRDPFQSLVGPAPKIQPGQR